MNVLSEDGIIFRNQYQYASWSACDTLEKTRWQSSNLQTEGTTRSGCELSFLSSLIGNLPKSMKKA